MRKRCASDISFERFEVMMLKTKQTIKPFLSKAINIVFPPQCISCKVKVESNGTLCHKCWEAIEFISAPQCIVCGVPFELQDSNQHICGKCIANPPKYTAARSVLRYNDASSKLITNFKYYDNTASGSHFAKWIMRAGGSLIDQADIIAPVPLHKVRLLSRRYNQSALLCNNIAKLTGKPVYNKLLIRHKNTKPQAELSFNMRVNNVKSAFKVDKKFINEIIGKNILLVDDVITTGSTIDACTKVLLKAGAKNVFVVTLAMTVKD